VSLALHRFQRVIGLRDGRVAFDAAPTDVTATDLDDLYSTELASSEQP
jgi:ABC-type phosphate/phosphonate transport system ATPase subunit